MKFVLTKKCCQNTHTHTHTHTYIYIYIYMRERERGRDLGKKLRENDLDFH